MQGNNQTAWDWEAHKGKRQEGVQCIMERDRRGDRMKRKEEDDKILFGCCEKEIKVGDGM
jgi:hypothetical protein